MKYLLSFLLVGMFSLSMSFPSGSKVPDSFMKLVEANELEFRMPDSFKIISTHKNPDMSYDFALKSKTKDIEIRYAIMPLKDLVDSFEKSKTDTSMKVINPDAKFAKMVLWMSTYNIADSVFGGFDSLETNPMYKALTSFPAEDVKHDFNADWGAFATLIPRKTFAKGYDHCIIVVIHKSKIANACMVYLYNKTEDTNTIFKNEVFDALRFRE